MSWNQDQLYRVRHHNSTFGASGQDYYRHHYQQQQQQQRRFQHHHHLQHHQTPMESATPAVAANANANAVAAAATATPGGYLQDHHASKMMKLDCSSNIYPHYNIGASGAASVGSQSSRARSIQQIRYQHQPIRLGNSKDSSKENCTSDDLLLNNDDKKEPGNGDSNQQQSQTHLVKTISDLPVFVTIEDFRVASYTIAGEPHLCLPQLLQFLGQHFDTKTMVEKFEESMIHFPSATPKQVEGFIKSSCLPPNATSCPLIKRSDADKICLCLFEELSNTAQIRSPSDIVSLCSEQQQHQHQQQQQEQKQELQHREEEGDEEVERHPKIQEKHSDIPNKVDGEESNCAVNPPEKIESKEQCPEQTKSQINVQDDDRHDDDVIIVDKNKGVRKSPDCVSMQQEEDNTRDDDNYAAVKKKLKCNNDEPDTAKSDSSTSTQDASEDIDRNEPIVELSREKISPISGCGSVGVDGQSVKQSAQSNEDTTEPKSVGASSAGSSSDTLFDSEAQSSILNFARAATSTLMIRVYHKCFGKCIGLFYPSLLKSKQLECIQCTTCKIMLTPRRFVGHTHGLKENDVCHWGFNSYNWRSYISLSKKQPMNNLDEDELLLQFNKFIASSEAGHSAEPSPAPATQTTRDRSNSFASQPDRLQDHGQSFVAESLARSQPLGPPTSCYISGDSASQPSTSSNMSPITRHHSSVSMSRRSYPTDRSSSLTLQGQHSASATPSSSIIAQPSAIDCASQRYMSWRASGLDDRSAMRLARSSSLSGRIPSSACCSGSSGGANLMTSAPLITRMTPKHGMDSPYGLSNMSSYPTSAAAVSNAVASGLFGQQEQLTGDLHNYLLRKWTSPPRGPHLQQQPTVSSTTAASTSTSAAAVAAAAAHLSSMLPLGGLPVTAAGGQPCNLLGSSTATRSNHEDLTKHLSLSAESKRELYVCTNLSTYLSRRGLSAGMTGDIVEKVLNLMRESRLTL